MNKLKTYKCAWRDSVSSGVSQQASLVIRASSYEEALDRTLKSAIKFGVKSPSVDIKEVELTPKITQKNALGALKL